jgi:uncharacterized short protein YbdD (DUF466 family)
VSTVRVWRGVCAYLGAVAGMPDYAAYLRHVERDHPGQVPLTREEHFAQFVDQRYSGVSRCC